MSIEKINLRKLLQLFFADPRQQRALLLADIRNDRTKASGDREGGGDFYGPFWSDVKDHVAGRSDIAEQTAIRIAANGTRARLYPLLRDSFVEMWNERMRWRNEPFEFMPSSVHALLQIPQLGAIVKIENTAAVVAWDGSHRIIYPYFSERPSLTEDGARLGFWALSKSLPQYPIEDFRIIDFMRRAYYRPSDVRTRGDEEEQFVRRYRTLLNNWRRLRDERR